MRAVSAASAVDPRAALAADDLMPLFIRAIAHSGLGDLATLAAYADIWLATSLIDGSDAHAASLFVACGHYIVQQAVGTQGSAAIQLALPPNFKMPPKPVEADAASLEGKLRSNFHVGDLRRPRAKTEDVAHPARSTAIAPQAGRFGLRAPEVIGSATVGDGDFIAALRADDSDGISGRGAW